MMTPILDDLLNDSRLGRLFSRDDRHCALQLWILQIKSEQSTENRIVYGRLLPYSHSSDRWSSSDDNSFQFFGKVQAQIIRLNLYVKSAHCTELLRLLSAGKTILEISVRLKLGLSDRMNARFGATALATDELVYRPVAYLINRDAFDRRSPASPHDGAGAFSASITQIDKGALFRIGEDYDISLTKSAVKHLNADTGLDFGNADTTRFGDIELLVFPALDDHERRLLSVNWSDTPLALVARFNPLQVPQFSHFQFRLNIENDGNIAYSKISSAECGENNEFECKFEINEQLRARTDSTELEIFGFLDGHSREGTLCCRWRIGYVREIHVQGHLVGLRANPVKFDWLEKATRPSVSARVKTALTINRGNQGFASRIGGRETDPWVPANRELASTFARLHPPKSEGRFFMRWNQGDGEGRLQFVEWFRALLAKYQQHQVVIFDPYFESAGLGLMLLCAAPEAEYIVFTSLSKPSKNDGATLGESDKPTSDRINNLMASCEQNRRLLERIKLRVYGLKEGRLHDRYILVMAPDNLPIAGFNLSNSLQKAAENYPLLITPIPADILLEVEQYKSGLVQEAEAAQPEDETENPSIRPLFDSTTTPTTKAAQRYEPLRFLEKSRAGDVLSVWACQPSLKGLTGDSLKRRMRSLDLLKGDSLSLPETLGLHDYLAQQTGDFSDFSEMWEVLGGILAHSRTEDRYFSEIEPVRDFLEFLTRFLSTSFSRTIGEEDSQFAVIDAQLFQKSLDHLLHSSYHPHHLFRAIKYSALTWPEYFAIKFLWRYAPNALLAIAETQMAGVPVESQGPEAARLSLLSQIVSEISLTLEFDISEVQRDSLLCSNNGLLQWIGLNVVERQLDEQEGLATVLQLIANFPYPKQVQALGWMIHRAARKSTTDQIYNGLVAALHDAIPTIIPTDDLGRMVDSMRGHMRQLAWAEPWLFQDAVFPLLRDDRANTDDACEIWIQDLLVELGGQPLLFEREREGQTTNIAAFLFAYSSSERQLASLKSIKDILKRQQRIVQQPLASTSDWNRWDGAVVVSMWILTFARWSQYYLHGRGQTHSELQELSLAARELAMVRTMDEWRSEGSSKQSELAAFLDQVEKILSTDEDL
ncbi:VPA1262 family protein [Pseudomonas laurylsulfatiphila]|uniref:VPA1262 family protein n=1 Tax=Pseudomonas laurylsulfatiphila TaxID=2011015 RepID=UPI003D1DE91D